MIDNFAIFLFSVLIVYTVFRAIRLDSIIPWFKADDQQEPPALKKASKKNK